jgi:hypothetical protein
MMKKVMFRRESNNFDDILSDPVLKKYLKFKIRFLHGLIIEVPEESKILSYIELKHGDDIEDNIVPDRSPIMNVDYIPNKPTVVSDLLDNQ